MEKKKVDNLMTYLKSEPLFFHAGKRKGRFYPFSLISPYSPTFLYFSSFYYLHLPPPMFLPLPPPRGVLFQKVANLHALMEKYHQGGCPVNFGGGGVD
jgi:hypothetical protein